MDANQQTKSLLGPLAGADVTLNIGLSRGANHTNRTVPHRLRVMTKLLPQIMEAGYIAEIMLTPKRVYTGEPLLIVQGTFKYTVADSLLLWDALIEADQDCIAIYCHNDFPGLSFSTLFGPKAEDWGQFNINLFKFIGDPNE
jgi:hypothetical protein